MEEMRPGHKSLAQKTEKRESQHERTNNTFKSPPKNRLSNPLFYTKLDIILCKEQ